MDLGLRVEGWGGSGSYQRSYFKRDSRDMSVCQRGYIGRFRDT